MLPSGLPSPDPASAEHSARVAQFLRAAIIQAGGWLSFERWMALALYAPGLGYYTAGSAKLGGDAAHVSGDFVTAPELTPLFGQTLASQVAHVLHDTGAAHILEFGAGTGALAEALLTELDAQNMRLDAPVRYDILEVSADLRTRQQTRLKRYGNRVRWRDALPDEFIGCVIANEVLDAMPVRLFRWHEKGNLLERGVSVTSEAFVWAERPADTELTRAVSTRMPALPDYHSEINLHAEAWVRSMGQWLKRGAAFLIDYGFPQREYYHPQRASGTLMCHYRHHSHSDPLWLPGLQDLTAHVDFTAMAEAALAGGLSVDGYTSQARFLIEAGLPARVQAAMQAALHTSPDPQAQARAISQLNSPVQKLLSEAEMGELFKILVLSRGLHRPLPALIRGNRRGALGC